MTPIEIVRDVCARRRVPSSLVVSCDGRRSVLLARRECMRAIVEAHPDIKPSELSRLLGYSREGLRRAITVAGLVRVGRRLMVDPGVPPPIDGPDPMAVIIDVCMKSRVAVRSVMGRSKRKIDNEVRLKAMVAVRKRCPQISFPEMGRLFGRNHSTIVKMLQRAEARRQRKPAERALSCH